jgi:hypothetical protein
MTHCDYPFEKTVKTGFSPSPEGGPLWRSVNVSED